MDAPEPAAAPPRQPFPSWKQALVTLGGGLVLAPTSCIGFLMSFGNNFSGNGNVFSAITGFFFVVGALAVLVGAFLVFVCIIRALTKKRGT